MKTNVLNEDKLKARLELVQTRSQTNEITIEDIQESIEYLESRLAELLPKKYWQGCSVYVDVNAVNKNTSYTPKTTHFRLERGASSWFVHDVYREYRNTHRYRGLTEHVLKYSEESVIHRVKQITDSTIVRPRG